MTLRIAIIGAGQIGKALAIHLSKTAHRVSLSNSRGADTLADTVASIGGNLFAADLEEALAEADVVFNAIPWTNLQELAQKLRNYPGKIFVDASNNIVSLRPFTLADTGVVSTGEFNARLFEEQRLVKAFNTLPAAVLAKPSSTEKIKSIIFLNGNDVEAKETVKQLISEMSFVAVDLGSFSDSGKLQDVGGALSGSEFFKVTGSK